MTRGLMASMLRWVKVLFVLCIIDTVFKEGLAFLRGHEGNDGGFDPAGCGEALGFALRPKEADLAQGCGHCLALVGLREDAGDDLLRFAVHGAGVGY